MNNSIRRENFNHKLKWLIYFWQDNTEHPRNILPSHRIFFDMCSILYKKSHQEHIDLFEDYMLTGIDNGYFPDNFSQTCKKFFAPIIALWHEIAETPEEVIPLCEDILFLAEALSRCSIDTNQIVFNAYKLTDSQYFIAKEKSCAHRIQNQLPTHEKNELKMQYQIAKKRWKKIPFWVSLVVKCNYPYN